MADSVVGRQQLSQAQEIQYKEWQKKVWPTNMEEETTKAVGNEANTANNKNTSPNSSMDALLSASITVDNNNREEEDEGSGSGSKSSHGWW